MSAMVVLIRLKAKVSVCACAGVCVRHCVYVYVHVCVCVCVPRISRPRESASRRKHRCRPPHTSLCSAPSSQIHSSGTSRIIDASDSSSFYSSAIRHPLLSDTPHGKHHRLRDGRNGTSDRSLPPTSPPGRLHPLARVVGRACTHRAIRSGRHTPVTLPQFAGIHLSLHPFIRHPLATHGDGTLGPAEFRTDDGNGNGHGHQEQRSFGECGACAICRWNPGDDGRERPRVRRCTATQQAGTP